MNFDEIDAFLLRLSAAENDDHLRAMFNEYNAEFDLNVPDDPFSNEYRRQQMSLYKDLARQEYSINNEKTPFDIQEMLASPFPYCHKSSETIGDTLLAIGYLIKNMGLSSGASILEFGAGWGNTSIELAKAGYKVTAIDIEENFVELINLRGVKESLSNVKAMKGEFFDIDKFNEKFDAILFFESFHHCDDHNLLLSKIDRVLNPGGKIVFGAEPITTEFPIPWGLRMDGQSLWAIRRNGWLELGFNRDYFTEALSRCGYFIDYHDGKDGPWSKVAIATRKEEYVFKFDANSGMKSEVGTIEEGKIKGSKIPGYLMYGPYTQIEKGTYLVTIQFQYSGKLPLTITCDLVSGSPKATYFLNEISISSQSTTIQEKVSIDNRAELLELRIFALGSEDLTIERIEFNRLA